MKTNPLQKVDILGIPLHAGTLEDAVSHVIEVCSKKERMNLLISATGAHGLVHSTGNPGFAEALRCFHLNLPDGMPTVWIGKALGFRRMDRCYGPDFFQMLMRRTADLPIKHYLCGGKEGVPEELRDVCTTIFRNANIVGCYSPPFREISRREFETIASAIKASKADVVWIGMSTPKQEAFALILSEYVKVHFIVTVGAAFDFHVGRVKQAPAFIQRMGLEWLFRLIMEPRRLFGRYIKIVPVFLYHGIREIAVRRIFSDKDGKGLKDT